MMDALTVFQVVKDVGTMFVIFVVVMQLVGKNSDMLSKMFSDRKAENEAWGKERKAETEAWMELVTRQREELGRLGGVSQSLVDSVAGLRGNIESDKVATMAYQTTTANGITELLKETRGVREAVNTTSTTILSVMSKNQHATDESGNRHQLDIKADLAKTNNAMLEMQKAVGRIEKAMADVPKNTRDAIAPLVLLVEQALARGQVAQENKVVEKDLSEGNGASSTDGKNAVPTNTGDIHIIPTGETVVAE